jgi:hypothetical protein
VNLGASDEPKDDVAAAEASWARARRDDPVNLLLLYSDFAVM